MVTTRSQKRALDEAAAEGSSTTTSAARRREILDDLPVSFRRPEEPATKRSKRFARGVLHSEEEERELGYYIQRLLLEKERGR